MSWVVNATSPVMESTSHLSSMLLNVAPVIAMLFDSAVSPDGNVNQAVCIPRFMVSSPSVTISERVTA